MREDVQKRLSKPLGILKAASEGHIIKHGLLMKEFAKVLRVIEDVTRREESVCTYGCEYCCYRMPLLHSKMEFDFVRGAIGYNLVLTRPWMAEYEKMWDSFASIMGPTHLSTIVAWRGAKVPCPMLKDDHCAIYDNRPVECRVRGAPMFHMATCFPDAPIYPMETGLTTDSAYSISDSVTEMSQCWSDPFEFRFRESFEDIEGLLRTIDKWVYNYEGRTTPLIEAVK